MQAGRRRDGGEDRLRSFSNVRASPLESNRGPADRAIPASHPEDANMRRSLAWTVPLLTACAVLRGGGPLVDTEVAVRSHNASDVDVYLLCGDRDAEWLGVVPRRS